MLISLQEDSFEGEDKYYEKNAEDIEIPNIKAIIFGGDDSWQRKLKNILPRSFIFQSGEKEGFDKTILMNTQMIFLKTKNMNHGIYYKILKYIKNKNIKIEYVEATNIKMVREEIDRKIESEFKNNSPK